MNERFVRLITSLGWKERIDQEKNGRYRADYIKVFDVVINGVTHAIPISAYFWSFDKDEVPTECSLDFVLQEELRPNYGNRSTQLKSSSRIVCMLDHAGYMTALKFATFAHPVNHFKKDAKAILANQSTI